MNGNTSAPQRNEETYVRVVAWLTQAENDLKALARNPKANMGRRKVAGKRASWIARFRYSFIKEFG